MFTMAQKPWTPAAQLSVMGLQGASQSYAAMDKKQEFKKPKSNIFGDILPIVGMAAGAMLGGPLGMTATQGAMLGSGLGGAVGAAVGGQNAAQLGGMGVQGATAYNDITNSNAIMKRLGGGEEGAAQPATGSTSSIPSVDESLASLTKNPWAAGFMGRM